MAELHRDMLSNDNGIFAVFSIGKRNFVAEALVSHLILKYEALNCMQESRRNTCECQKDNGIVMDAKLSFAHKATYCDLIEYIYCILHKSLTILAFQTKYKQ